MRGELGARWVCEFSSKGVKFVKKGRQLRGRGW